MDFTQKHFSKLNVGTRKIATNIGYPIYNRLQYLQPLEKSKTPLEHFHFKPTFQYHV
jgi:hypothetical protein